MTFNKGFYCSNCGPIEKSKKKTIKKQQYDLCPNCDNIVTPWERPMNERAGRCSNCGNASFTLAIMKHHLLRCCKQCKEVYDIDAGKVVREGEKESEFEGYMFDFTSVTNDFVEICRKKQKKHGNVETLENSHIG